MGEVVAAEFGGKRDRTVTFEVHTPMGGDAGKRTKPRTNLFHHEAVRPLMKALDPFAQRAADRLIRQAQCEGWTVSRLTTQLRHATGLSRRNAEALGRTGIAALNNGG